MTPLLPERTDTARACVTHNPSITWLRIHGHSIDVGDVIRSATGNWRICAISAVVQEPDPYPPHNLKFVRHATVQHIDTNAMDEWLLTNFSVGTWTLVGGPKLAQANRAMPDCCVKVGPGWYWKDAQIASPFRRDAAGTLARNAGTQPQKARASNIIRSSRGVTPADGTQVNRAVQHSMGPC